jgi:hypothetical protein
LGEPIASVEDMLEVELPLELEVETSDADGIVAIEKMRMAKTELFYSSKGLDTKLNLNVCCNLASFFVFSADKAKK